MVDQDLPLHFSLALLALVWGLKFRALGLVEFAKTPTPYQPYTEVFFGVGCGSPEG